MKKQNTMTIEIEKDDEEFDLSAPIKLQKFSTEKLGQAQKPSKDLDQLRGFVDQSKQWKEWVK